ncbi:MAG: virulence-associated protein E [Mesorhizobium sp. SCN 65-20]|nr:MAG: virulence-associated protein E [Mesorhizobium sp. SCN 65-20]
MLNIKAAADRLGGDAYGGNRLLCPGPGHSRADRSLSVRFNADGSFAVKSFAGDDWRECRDHVKAVLGLSDARPVAFNDNAPHIDVDRLRRQHDALSIWARSIPIAGTLAERYLQSRGLAYDGDALRFYRGGRAMVALITDAITGEPCGIHRTFLDRDGNRTEKKMLGRAGGGVVRLSADADVTRGLGIAEGIETALAAPFRPIWACLSAGAMKAFPVLAGITALSIFADQDRAGLDAANTCGERWHAADREVTMAAPTVGDFADRRAA